MRLKIKMRFVFRQHVDKGIVQLNLRDTDIDNDRTDRSVISRCD